MLEKNINSQSDDNQLKKAKIYTNLSYFLLNFKKIQITLEHRFSYNVTAKDSHAPLNFLISIT